MWLAEDSVARLSIEIDLHRAVGGRGDLEAVFANIQLGAAGVVPFPGFAPGAQYGCNPNGLTTPHELRRKSGPPTAMREVSLYGTRRSDSLTDESVRHDHFASTGSRRCLGTTSYADLSNPPKTFDTARKRL